MPFYRERFLDDLFESLEGRFESFSGYLCHPEHDDTVSESSSEQDELLETLEKTNILKQRTLEKCVMFMRLVHGRSSDLDQECLNAVRYLTHNVSTLTLREGVESLTPEIAHGTLEASYTLLSSIVGVYTFLHSIKSEPKLPGTGVTLVGIMSKLLIEILDDVASELVCFIVYFQDNLLKLFDIESENPAGENNPTLRGIVERALRSSYIALFGLCSGCITARAMDYDNLEPILETPRTLRSVKYGVYFAKLISTNTPPRFRIVAAMAAKMKFNLLHEGVLQENDPELSHTSTFRTRSDIEQQQVVGAASRFFIAAAQEFADYSIGKTPPLPMSKAEPYDPNLTLLALYEISFRANHLVDSFSYDLSKYRGRALPNIDALSYIGLIVLNAHTVLQDVTFHCDRSSYNSSIQCSQELYRELLSALRHYHYHSTFTDIVSTLETISVIRRDRTFRDYASPLSRNLLETIYTLCVRVYNAICPDHMLGEYYCENPNIAVFPGELSFHRVTLPFTIWMEDSATYTEGTETGGPPTSLEFPSLSSPRYGQEGIDHRTVFVSGASQGL